MLSARCLELSSEVLSLTVTFALPQPEIGQRLRWKLHFVEVLEHPLGVRLAAGKEAEGAHGLEDGHPSP